MRVSLHTSIVPYWRLERSASSSPAADGSGAFGGPGNPGWAERGKAALNPTITIDELSSYAHDHHYFVRVAATKNRRIPIELLANLATDQSRFVRAAVACSPNVTFDLLAALEQDSDAWVRSSATENIRNAFSRGFDEQLAA